MGSSSAPSSYGQVAEKLKAESGVVVAQMDASANDAVSIESIA